MKGFCFGFLTLVFGLLFAANANAAVIGGERFEKTIYVSAAVDTTTKSANNSGRDYASAKGFFDGDLLAIPANVIIENVYVVVDEAVAGITAFNLGDDDNAAGFIVSASPLDAPEDLGDTGLHYWNVDYKGAYAKCGVIVSNQKCAKFYSATGKKLKLDVTGTASAGKLRVIVEGYAVGDDE